MLVEPEVAIKNDTKQLYMVREWHDAASDVYRSTSWHDRSDSLTRPKNDGFGLVWVDCEAIVQEPGMER